jgi:NADPH-ferrihemoprotein reductase
VVIFWGSQSGTAEGFANRLVRDCRSRLGLDALAADLSEYDPESIANIPNTKVAVFILSTYGEGDPSDNTAQLFSWLSTSQATKFPNLRYAAFGLGNSKYKFYNRVVDVVAGTLDQLEACAIIPIGKADDSEGTTEEDFSEWKQSLFPILCTRLNCIERAAEYEPSLKVVEDPSLELIDLHHGEPVKPREGKKASAPSSVIHPLEIRNIRNLLSTAGRNCLHIELDTSEHTQLKYKTGDHLAVWPSNPISEVTRLINVLGLQNRKDVPLLISSFDPSIDSKVPSPTTAEVLFKYYLEICTPVPRETILSIAQFALSPETKAQLLNMGSDKGSYHNYCSSNHVTLGRLLEAFSPPQETWSNLPLSFVLEILPRLSPRYYSISSSSIVSPKQIAITVATSTLNAQNLPIPGLTTSYLSCIERSTNSSSQPQGSPSTYDLSGPNNLLQSTKIFAHIRTSKFRLPVLPKSPIIMVASGSGIAPFRGFLQERARLAMMGRPVGPTKLFFGCRSADIDFLYRDELAELQSSLGATLEFVTAFSRCETNGSGGKMYVQDRVREHEEEVVRLLVEENAYFYVCGSANMARDLGSVVGGCLQRTMGWGEKELREWSEGMKRTRRWQEDVWG